MLAGATRANPKVDPDVMRWQYFENPFGSAVGWVWEDDGEVVCHLPGSPSRCSLGDGRAAARSRSTALRPPRTEVAASTLD